MSILTIIRDSIVKRLAPDVQQLQRAHLDLRHELARVDLQRTAAERALERCQQEDARLTLAQIKKFLPHWSTDIVAGVAALVTKQRTSEVNRRLACQEANAWKNKYERLQVVMARSAPKMDEQHVLLEGYKLGVEHYRDKVSGVLDWYTNRVVETAEDAAVWSSFVERLKSKETEPQGFTLARQPMLQFAPWYNEKEVRPGWRKSMVVLWTEDECLRNDPDAERVDAAFHRLSGGRQLEQLGATLAVEGKDDDTEYKLYAGGWVIIEAYNGSAIARVVGWADRTAQFRLITNVVEFSDV